MPPIGRDKSRAERRQRQHQTAEFALRRKERVADLDGEEAVGDEVVKLEHIADGRGERGAPYLDTP